MSSEALQPLSAARLLLASSSPRRSELLRSAGYSFDRFDPDVDETSCDHLNSALRVLAIAEMKARDAALRAPQKSRLVLAADTLVCLEGDDKSPERILGKPTDRSEAAAMLRALSGQSHLVRTGLALLDRQDGRLRTSRSDTRVYFSALAEGQIEDYLDTEEWRGVAGAYRIQGAAVAFVERLEGSWSGVVGLPMGELYVILRDVVSR